ncbi:helix-turn-helix domain-containing protein [Streptomyces sp. NPDC056628]|uniref:helix-turn-helix domain-containing protein n=1 Tax=Streptomyces sp. NPDC056628 TaxID=3345882 RepID=UPI00369120ED
MKVDPVVEQAMNDAELRIGRNMRRIRENLDLSQADLAERLTKLGYRFHQTQVAKVERGERAVRVNEWIAIAEALGIQPMALMAGGLGTDDAVFEARLQFERMRSAVEDASSRLYQAGLDLETVNQLYREALAAYLAAAAEAGQEIAWSEVEVQREWAEKLRNSAAHEYAGDLDELHAGAKSQFEEYRRGMQAAEE